MPYFTLHFGLNTSANQAEILDAVKSSGGDGIQASGGLHVRIEMNESEFRAWLRERAPDVKVTTIDTQAALKNPDTAPDLKAFIAK